MMASRNGAGVGITWPGRSFITSGGGRMRGFIVTGLGFGFALTFFFTLALGGDSSRDRGR